MTRSKWLLRIAFLAALALTAAACGGDEEEPTEPGATEEPVTGGAEETCAADEFGCAEIAEGEPIRIGTLLAISGDVASLGLDSQNAVALAVDGLDGSLDGTPGQLVGHDVELINEDDGCSAEGGQTGARRLASEENLVAVVGTSCSSAALGVADQILGEEGIVLISPSNTSPALTDPANHQAFYLRTAHNDKIQGAAVAEFAATELGAQSAATIHDGSTYAEGLANAFAAVFQDEFGGTITTQEAVQVGDTDFKPLLENIAADAPDFLFYPIFNPEGPLITQQARETAGLEGTDLAGADGLLTPDFITQAGEASEGVYISGPSLEFSGDFYADEFLPAYQEQFGSEPTAAFHAHSYDAANIIFQAIEQVAIEEDGTLFIPRTGLKDAMFATDYSGIVGPYQCDENGDCAQEASISVNLIQNGDFEVVFTKSIALPE
jgi:branched-chain amino acid transport system substrate-binding protein